ncbi:MAG: bifunctional oligoribonuclease/PAP phosphatase NrnA [Chloroflexota bacterium]|nr:bifunctional oligoribonuclease/PAP phosphatase NrnA [Chloroflexota bacterium]
MTTNKNTTLKQASQLIRSAHRPLLICHIAPDGDAIGSLTGLGWALRHKALEPIMACSDPIPARFNYIPGVSDIVQDVNVSFDLVISLDCSDLKRLGRFPQMPAFDSTPLLNIDHHLTNLDFGDVNLVDPHASSTAEIVLRLLEYMALPLDAELSTCLLTGIVGDTRGFRTSNVTIQVMDAALRLMKAGASLPYVTQHGLDRRPTAAIRLWGAALAQLQIKNRVIWVSIPLAVRRATGYMGNGDAGLVSFLVSADDADVAVVFVEREDGRIEVGLRAVPGFNVARVALRLGGGGHALAAGCNLPGPPEEAQTRVLAALWADLARQRHT